MACEDDKVVGCGSIYHYYRKEDEFFLRGKRIEIPASITACQFYRKLGYGYKDGINKIDNDQLYRLEKFNR